MGISAIELADDGAVGTIEIEEESAADRSLGWGYGPIPRSAKFRQELFMALAPLRPVGFAITWDLAMMCGAGGAVSVLIIQERAGYHGISPIRAIRALCGLIKREWIKERHDELTGQVYYSFNMDKLTHQD